MPWMCAYVCLYSFFYFLPVCLFYLLSMGSVNECVCIFMCICLLFMRSLSSITDILPSIFFFFMRWKVWEITGAEFSSSTTHSADNISIRFPRVTRIRDDKVWRHSLKCSLPRCTLVIFSPSTWLYCKQCKALLCQNLTQSLLSMIVMGHSDKLGWAESSSGRIQADFGH